MLCQKWIGFTSENCTQNPATNPLLLDGQNQGQEGTSPPCHNPIVSALRIKDVDVRTWSVLSEDLLFTYSKNNFPISPSASHLSQTI